MYLMDTMIVTKGVNIFIYFRSIIITEIVMEEFITNVSANVKEMYLLVAYSLDFTQILIAFSLKLSLEAIICIVIQIIIKANITKLFFMEYFIIKLLIIIKEEIIIIIVM